MSSARGLHLRAAFLIFGCTVSGGLVALPSAFQKVALLPALGFTLIVGVTNALSLFSLSLVSSKTGLPSYGEVAVRIGGPLVGALVDCTIGFFLVGVLAGTLIVMRDFFDFLPIGTMNNSTHPNGTALLADGPHAFPGSSGMLGGVMGADAAVGAFEHTTFVKLATAGVASLIIFPLALPRSIGVLAYTSFISMTAFAMLVAVLVFYGVDEIAAGQLEPFNKTWWPQAVDAKKEGQSFTVLVYTFASQFQLMDIYQDLASRISRLPDVAPPQDEAAVRAVPPPYQKRPPPRVHFAQVVALATSAQILLFALAGCFGVLAFPGRTVDGGHFHLGRRAL